VNHQRAASYFLCKKLVIAYFFVAPFCCEILTPLNYDFLFKISQFPIALPAQFCYYFKVKN
jgi:hypothetical protein